MWHSVTLLFWQLERKRFRIFGERGRILVTFVLVSVLLYAFVAIIIRVPTFSLRGISHPKSFSKAQAANSPIHTSLVSKAEVVVTNLIEIFRHADQDGNSFLDGQELTAHINRGVSDHFSKAIRDNFDRFLLLDTNPKNGLISWDEYLAFFFRIKSIQGVNANDIRSRTSTFTSLPKNIKVEIARLQASWFEASATNPDVLSIDEFLAFEHPEVSPTKILTAVQDTFATFDLNGDGTITNNEFQTTYKEAEGVDPVYRNDIQLIDANGNGEISLIELMSYMDPRAKHHSQKDAKELIKSVDKDMDGRLSLVEVLQGIDKIVTSKLYDAGKSLHKQL